jgi:predicted nucleotide-binding protein
LAKINQELIDRLADKLGIGVKALYPRIQKIVQETGLERDLAALVLARRNTININKFSTLGQRNEIRRNAPAPAGEQEPQREPRPEEPPRRASKAKKPARTTKGKSVFVVHGRDEALRKSMFDFLRALGPHPMEWDHALRTARSKGANPYVGHILDEVMEKAQAVVVMFSPDDLVQLKEQFLHADDRSTEGKPQGQARPNVLFEAGLAMGRHPQKTVLVQVGKVKSFSDVGGRHLVRLTETTDSRHDLANRLEALHCEVDKVGRDWMKAGDFVPTEPKPAKKKSAKR